MDMVDHLAASQRHAVLFLRCDEYVDCPDRESLHEAGVPRNLEAICERLARERIVLIVIDSLDVLSLSRSHGPLGILLTLLDRLQRIDGVSVIAACREFDNKYDPRLASRSWDDTIICQPLAKELIFSLLSGWHAQRSRLICLICCASP